MKIGFAGAGKVGFTLGKYFSSKGYTITGYYDKDFSCSEKAGEFTSSKPYESIIELLNDCDTLFLTVPDMLIGKVYSLLDKKAIKGKLICHCSGAVSAQEVFPDAQRYGAYICSVHPLLAVSSKYNSYREITDGFFAIEGCNEGVRIISELLQNCNNSFQIIDSESKRKYHCASAICSNLAVGLMDISLGLLTECGFSRENALKAISPIITSNITHIAEKDVKESLTGPVERCDTETVKKHLSVLSGRERGVYILLSQQILKIAQEKNPDRDYSKLTELLKGEEL